MNKGNLAIKHRKKKWRKVMLMNQGENQTTCTRRTRQISELVPVKFFRALED